MAQFKYKGFTSKVAGSKVYDVGLAKQDLLNHIMTKKGERVMAPEFGSIVWDYLFDPLTPAIQKIIRDDIESIIAQDIRFTSLGTNVVEVPNGFTLLVQLYYIPDDLSDQLLVEFDRTISETK